MSLPQVDTAKFFVLKLPKQTVYTKQFILYTCRNLVAYDNRVVLYKSAH